MQDAELLDYLEALFQAAEHPEVKETTQYTGALDGVKVIFEAGAVGYLSIVKPKNGGR